MGDASYLTVAEVAAELGMSTSGVYKLIQREKLGAIRLSERKTVVARIALDAYRRRLKYGPPPPPPLMVEHVDLEVLTREFRDTTGAEPEEWLMAWKADRIEDTAENMRHMIRALGILAARRESSSDDPAGTGPLAGVSSVAR
jgi:excisionase family DNA binding protein